MEGVAVVTPRNRNVVKVGTISPGVIVAPQSPLDEVTIIFPQSPTDGQIMFLSFTQPINSVHFTNASFANGSLLGPSVKAGDSITLFFNAKTGKWFRLSGGSA